MGITALFGGTFNPPHIGHYEILRVLDGLDSVDKVWIMPDRIPPHKVCDFLAGNGDRINMCRLMAEDFKKAELCLVEFEREGKSYSIDTVRQLKTAYPQKEFAFVCGGDMLTSFDKWYKYEELINEIPFIVFKRVGESGEEFEKSAERYRKMGMRLTVMDNKIPQVASSVLRNGKADLRKYLPSKVYKYIADGGIYGVGK